MVGGGWKYPDDTPRPGLGDWSRILREQRELEGLKAAIRDPATGVVYSGWTHQQAIESVPIGDDSGAWGRLSTEWHEETPNSGFIDRDGQFISRDEAGTRWSVLTMEDIRDRLKAIRGSS